MLWIKVFKFICHTSQSTATFSEQKVEENLVLNLLNVHLPDFGQYPGKQEITFLSVGTLL